MEARGESGVVCDGEQMPLSGYLQNNPSITAEHDLLLLKVLDPSPQPVLGDLYFEVHEEKREVYIVTHVDPTAWPDGTGKIRFGMAQDMRQQYSDDDGFRAAYLSTVQAYEKIRRSIDDGVPGLEQAEQEARDEMEAFTDVFDLRVGDVVKVPTWTPHALQHGVRVVEFQTQTYERYIVSFAQKVLTQDHWDTEYAVAKMLLEKPAEPDFEQISPGVERIARFDHFNVWRVNGAAAGKLNLPRTLPYVVLMALGTTEVGDLQLASEEACLVPGAAIADLHISSQGTLLLAAPNL